MALHLAMSDFALRSWRREIGPISFTNEKFLVGNVFYSQYTFLRQRAGGGGGAEMRNTNSDFE